MKLISNLGSKIWDLVPSNIKEISELNKFGKAIKQWKPEDCLCRLCKVFVQNVGFLEKYLERSSHIIVKRNNLKHHLKFDISKFGNTHVCACVVF